MIKKTCFSVFARIGGAALVAMALASSSASAGPFLGPLNPGFESGSADWNSGGPQVPGGSNSFYYSDNGPTDPGTNCAFMTADGSISPPNGNDIRVNYFSLGAAAHGNESIMVQFDYNMLTPINFGDQIRVGIRFEDANGGFLGEHNFHLGTPNGAVGGQGWQHFVGIATAIPTAVTMDIRISMNIFGDDIWSSGDVLYDNFSVTANPGIGPLNPGFENGSQNWFTGGPNDSGGSASYVNSPTNGPSFPGTNCVEMTADGTVSPPNGNDIRAAYFSLGAATQGANAISIDFDYNILGAVNYGDQIRVGCRFEDGNGNFLGEHNFHIGTPNNDTGGQGWLHFHGVAVPTFSAVNMDIRISMNIFGDDIWSSGPMLFDNFVVGVTPAIGPNNNGGFENGGANWNAGGSGGSAGSISYNNLSNGWSEPGTNSILQTSDGTGNTDFRVNEYSLANNTQPVTISFDYNILNAVNSGNQIRVGLRFFDGNNNFAGEYNSHIGTPNGDTGGQGWKHYSASAVPPGNAVSSDIRVSMNIFGDDTWSSGPVLYDNFTVITGTLSPPVANGVTIGTIKGTPVTRLMVGASQPATDGNGYPLIVSYISHPADGTLTTDGTSVTYTPNGTYTGNDQFTFGLSDGLGGFTTGTASVVVNPTIGLNKFTSSANVAGNNSLFTLSGAAYCNYILQSTASLISPIVWTPQLTNTADGSGTVLFTNQESGNAVFFRTKLAP